jgi:uncharacterized repeat protein (TIGR03803 family)
MKNHDLKAACDTWHGPQHAFGMVPLLALFLLLAILPAVAQTYTVLHAFTGRPDGRSPEARVLRDNTGALYTTTYSGGAFAYGTVFQIDPHGKSTVLHSFWGGEGLATWSGLIRDKSGNLYGTTVEGGTPEGNRMAPLCDFGCGTVFKLDTAGKVTVIRAFSGGADGGVPEAGLIHDDAGNLYGTTTNGGNIECPGPGYTTGCGVVFKIDTNGKETVLHAFSGSDGWWPSGELLRDSHGNLYGLTLYGGDYQCAPYYGCGTVFKIDTRGKETVLYNFPGGSSSEYPRGSLTQDTLGNLYGTASGEQFTNYGLVFKLDKKAKETVVYAFQGGPDGAYPMGGVMRDRLGNLFGTTEGGGLSNCTGNPGCGTIFKIDTSGKETVLYSFTGGSDGAEPEDGLVMDHAGNLYGTTPYGGDLSCGYNYPSGCGVVFKLTP